MATSQAITGSTPPTATRLSLVTGTLRQTDYWWTVFKRTWKGGAISSFVSPLFYVLAMGVLLGGFIEGDPSKLEGATSYLAFIVPGLVATHAMTIAVGETTYPVMGAVKWHKTYFSMIATPLEPRHLVAANMMFVLFRLATACGLASSVMPKRSSATSRVECSSMSWRGEPSAAMSPLSITTSRSQSCSASSM